MHAGLPQPACSDVCLPEPHPGQFKQNLSVKLNSALNVTGTTLDKLSLGSLESNSQVEEQKLEAVENKPYLQNGKCA